MAWARIHDSALSSPKIVKLFDPRDPFHLWVWGLSYCQLHLTDGAIPVEAIPHGGLKAAPVLVARRLWEVAEDGYQVHDYFDWNDSREVVTKKRAAARSRMSVARERSREQYARTKQEQIPRTSTEVLRGVASSSVVEIVDPISNQHDPERERERKPLAAAPDSRSRRPIFSGQRLTVFEWQLDDCTRTLGDYTDAFDLHEFFFALDAAAVSKGLVIPKRDGGEFLQSQLVLEAQRRGIPLRMASAAALGKQTTKLAAALGNIKSEAV